MLDLDKGNYILDLENNYEIFKINVPISINVFDFYTIQQLREKMRLTERDYKRHSEPEDQWLSKNNQYLIRFDSPILQVSKNVVAYEATNSQDH